MVVRDGFDVVMPRQLMLTQHTTTTRDALPKGNISGMLIWNTTSGKMNFFNGATGAWEEVASA